MFKNSKNQNMKKLKNSKCDKNLKIKFDKTQKHKILEIKNSVNAKTKKKSKLNKTKETQIETKLITLNCDKFQKLKL